MRHIREDFSMRGYGKFFDDVLDPEDRNYRENTAKQVAGNGPQVIAGTDSAPTQEDASAIVARVAFEILRNELDWSTSDVLESHPALNGLTREQIETAITEGLA